MLALKSFAVAAAALVAAFVLADLAEQPTDISPARAIEIVQSLVTAAETMHVELGDDCRNAIIEHVMSKGYERAGVTDKGAVMVRDAAGINTWVC